MRKVRGRRATSCCCQCLQPAKQAPQLTLVESAFIALGRLSSTRAVCGPCIVTSTPPAASLLLLAAASPADACAGAHVLLTCLLLLVVVVAGADDGASCSCSACQPPHACWAPSSGRSSTPASDAIMFVLGMVLEVVA
jgi:hypothetical protein